MGEGHRVQILLSFSSIERDRQSERKQSSAKICFLVSMTTADYYSQPSFIMKGSDFSMAGSEKKERERTGREVKPRVYLWEQRATCQTN